MRVFLIYNLPHVLAALILVSRLGDIISTRLATPTLKLEANPIAKKLGWPFAWASVLLCLTPYLDTGMAVTVLVPSLLVSSSNLSRVWLARRLGETGYHELLLRAARGASLAQALAAQAASALFFLLAAGVLLFLSPDPRQDWGFWFGLGMALYGAVIWLYGSLSVRRIFRQANAADA